MRSDFLFLFGIIPTRVGTRQREDALKQLAEDHPHACGDKDSVAVAGDTVTGSSPRVWGQVSA